MPITFPPLTAPFSDEQSQDAVGAILVDSATIDFTYNDATPSITAIVIDGSITVAKLSTDAKKIGLPYVLDGGGAVITTGEKAGYIRIPFTGTIEGWSLYAKPSGSIVIDSWIDDHASFPPTVGDAIWGGSKPTLSGATSAQATGLSIAVTEGDVLRHNVDSASTVTEATLNYHLVRA